MLSRVFFTLILVPRRYSPHPNPIEITIIDVPRGYAGFIPLTAFIKSIIPGNAMMVHNTIIPRMKFRLLMFLVGSAPNIFSYSF
jgi:hypothetical protein